MSDELRAERLDLIRRIRNYDAELFLWRIGFPVDLSDLDRMAEDIDMRRAYVSELRRRILRGKRRGRTD